MLNAEEDARFEAGLYNARGKRLLRRVGSIDAYRSRVVRFSTRFRPGRYSLRVQLKAEMNGARKSRFSTQLASPAAANALPVIRAARTGRPCCRPGRAGMRSAAPKTHPRALFCPRTRRR